MIGSMGDTQHHKLKRIYRKRDSRKGAEKRKGRRGLEVIYKLIVSSLYILIKKIIKSIYFVDAQLGNNASFSAYSVSLCASARKY